MIPPGFLPGKESLVIEQLCEHSVQKEKSKYERCRFELELALMDYLRGAGRLDCQHVYQEQFPDGLPDQHHRRHHRGVPSAEGITVIGSTLWYTSFRQRLLAAVDLRTGKEVQWYRLPGDPAGMCWDGAQFWYSDYMHRQICAAHPQALVSAGIPA